MARRDEVRRGRDRVRLGRWRSGEGIALISPAGAATPPGQAVVQEACRVLAARGFGEVLTGALAPDERPAFEAVGFEVRDRLHLLAHPLLDLPEAPPPAGVRLRRARPGDEARALAVDGAAFPAFWRLDRHGLREALDATPSARFRVAVVGRRWSRRVVGYAVTGRAGTTGYLQRLAVTPGQAGGGIGRALVADALAWLQRRGATTAYVNTQTANERALRLYEGMGFIRQPTGLEVLGRSLAAPPAAP